MKQLQLLAAGIAMAFASEAFAATEVNKFARDTEVCDPVLIYSGGLAKRPTWNEQNLRPYVTHLYADGHRDWFFDSFIFNETIRSTPDRGNVVLGNASAGQVPSVKEDWEWWVDHVFAPDHDLHALDKLIGKYKKELGEPRMRHKVIISACAPCKDGSGGGAVWADINWGEINGTKINLARKQHRIIATNWHIDQIKKRFEDEHFENIDLAGIYWIEESLFSNSDILPAVNAHIKSIGLRSYWIPYWENNDQYALSGMDKYGFDMVWRQPNYFFYKTGSYDLPDYQQLVDCIESSKKWGLGLELEFETQDKSNGMHEVSEKMHQRLIDYIDAFEKYGVWDESGVAHYGGSKGFVDMAASSDPVNQATMDRLASFVAKRQSAFAGISDVKADKHVKIAYTGPCEIFIAADSASVYDIAGTTIFKGNGRVQCQPGIYIVADDYGNACKVAVPSM